MSRRHDASRIMNILIYAALGLGVLVLILVVFLRRRRHERNGERELTALVFLMSQPRVLSEQQVREAIERVWDVKLGSELKEGGNWLVEAGQLSPTLVQPEANNYLVSAHGRMFLINSVRRPYMDEPEKFAESIPDLRLGRAVGTHRAWNSVDVFGDPPGEQERAEVYGMLGKLLAEFAGDDCLAIFCPALERCNEYTPAMVETLRSGGALSVFEGPTHAPVIQIDGDDPRMMAAVEEANRRWPEFVAAFQQRKSPDEIYAIKACFAEGDEAEFMWVSVQKLDGDSIVGRLENSPASIKSVREGDIVRVQRADLNDWLYGNNGQSVGGFTMKVMEQIMNK
jgi:uncharacterized protein YegJ (DUF2314 family)